MIAGIAIGAFIGTIAGYGLCAMMVISKEKSKEEFWIEWNGRNHER